MKILTPETTKNKTEGFRPQIFIGFDERQERAYEVCRGSILDNASGPIDIYPLNHKDLRRKQLFWREWVVDPKTGNYTDKIDGLPFSNQFSHTRFLVPEYCAYLGIRESWAIFVDLDFVFFDDIYKIFNDVYTTDGQALLYVVKHDFKPKNTEKMDHQIQTEYPRKLWSSMMLFHVPEVRQFTDLNLEYVNTAPSSALHRLEWVNEKYIGKIDESWNFIPGHSEENTDKIRALHFTSGLPNMPGYETSKYSRYYLDLERKYVSK